MKRRKGSWWYLLFVLQFAILWVPFYNKAQPTFLGVPFFYWFQLFWVVLCAVVTAVIYLATREPR